MKAAEIAALEISVRKVTAHILSTHAAYRMAQKGVTAKEIENCLKYGIAIEIHNEAGELRAVIRHAYGRPKVAICLVIGLESQTVVTTWKNAGRVRQSRDPQPLRIQLERQRRQPAGAVSAAHGRR